MGRAEGDFTRKITKEIEADGGMVVPLVASERTSGWPDRLYYHRLWHGLIEFKAINGRLSDQQRVNITALRRRQPYHCVVVRAPNRVEDESGNLLFLFGDGANLMQRLADWAAGGIMT